MSIFLDVLNTSTVLFCIATAITQIFSTINLHKNNLVKKYLNTNAASGITWFFVTFGIIGSMFFPPTKPNTNKIDGVALEQGWLILFILLSLSRILIDSILIANKNKLSNDENKAIKISEDNGQKGLDKVNFKLTIASVIINPITLVICILKLYVSNKNKDYYY